MDKLSYSKTQLQTVILRLKYVCLIKAKYNLAIKAEVNL